ncbi:MAG: DUF4417 domain-containing protein [Bacteroidales bacterium]|nr:DUF4417 domain-containing protein [Bacteroidales bacterium]
MIITDLPQDRLYPSDNEYEIPLLRLDRQPENGLLLPFRGWGTNARLKNGVATYHFYVDDYRFANIWGRPDRLVNSGCRECVEPNFSLFQTTPIAYAMQLLYKKRWIARWLQEKGICIWVDLNVAPKFSELNQLGVPKGYNAFATRGNADSPENLLTELAVAQKISGIENPNMIVYGGGRKVKALCLESGLLYVEQYMVAKQQKEDRDYEK